MLEAVQAAIGTRSGQATSSSHQHTAALGQCSPFKPPPGLAQQACHVCFGDHLARRQAATHERGVPPITRAECTASDSERHAGNHAVQGRQRARCSASHCSQPGGKACDQACQAFPHAATAHTRAGGSRYVWLQRGQVQNAIGGCGTHALAALSANARSPAAGAGAYMFVSSSRPGQLGGGRAPGGFWHRRRAGVAHSPIQQTPQPCPAPCSIRRPGAALRRRGGPSGPAAACGGRALLGGCGWLV